MSDDADRLLDGIRRWVEIESHTRDPDGMACMAETVRTDYADLGADVALVPGRDGYGAHVVVRAPWGAGSNAPGILLLSHIDTVHPRGTLARFPFSVEGDAAFGPGIYDMKGGAYIGMDAVRAVADAGGAPLPLTHLFVADEEEGSPTSRDLIVSLAQVARYVIVTEPAREGGQVVIARKGVMRYEVLARGRASHAGARHQDGHSAIAAIARTALRFHALTDYDRGITCNVGEIGGGTGVNVVPAKAWMRVDVRVPDADAATGIDAFVADLSSEEPGVTLEISGGLNRPAYETSEGGAALFARARDIATGLGFDLHGLTTGGGSDGNFTAPLAPTLDGMGVDGKGGHTDYEQLYISSLVPRRDLLAGLIRALE